MTGNKHTEGLSKTDLSSVLRSLKLYRVLQKKLWKRGVALFDAIRSGEKILRIDRFPSFGQKEAEAELEKAFGANYADGYKVVWNENPSLQWGLRVFFGDEMVDLSFSNAKRSFQ